jgi:hypothetical protein
MFQEERNVAKLPLCRKASLIQATDRGMNVSAVAPVAMLPEARNVAKLPLCRKTSLIQAKDMRGNVMAIAPLAIHQVTKNVARIRKRLSASFHQSEVKLSNL